MPIGKKEGKKELIACLAGGLAGILFFCFLLLMMAAAIHRTAFLQEHPRGVARVCFAVSSGLAAGIGCRGKAHHRLLSSLLSLLPIAAAAAVVFLFAGKDTRIWSFFTDLLIAVCGALGAAMCAPGHKRRKR